MAVAVKYATYNAKNVTVIYFEGLLKVCSVNKLQLRRHIKHVLKCCARNNAPVDVMHHHPDVGV